MMDWEQRGKDEQEGEDDTDSCDDGKGDGGNGTEEGDSLWGFES